MLGWKAGLSVTDNILQVAITDNAGQPVPHAQVSAHATHPLGADTDLVLRFAEARPGIYTTTLPAGRWQIHLLARAGGHDWHHVAEVTAQAGQ